MPGTNKKPTEIATIDVAMVTITPGGVNADTYLITTGSKILVASQIETKDAIKLMVKNRLISQKPAQKKITGTMITLTDNVFLPEIMKIFQGGIITFDALIVTKIIGYTPPLLGDVTNIGEVFILKAYSAQYDSAGSIVQYECTEYTSCRAEPIALNSEDGVFRVPEYIIISSPLATAPPYAITYIAALPVTV